MHETFHASIRRLSGGSYFVIIPKERVRFIMKEKGWVDIKGREVKVEVTL